MTIQAIRGHVRRADIEAAPDRRKTDSASAVMLAALDHGPVARSTIARLAGLSPAAVSRQCADLIRHGLLREVPERETEGAPAGKLGRPHVPVDLDVAGPVVGGVHIAVQHATVSLADLRGRVIASERIPHAAPDPGPVLDRVAARLRELAAGRGRRARVLGIGVAAGGWVDSAAGVIADHPLLGWRDVRVRALLEERTGLRVRVDGHSRALARAEQLLGDQRARSSVVHLFAGNVVDAAFAVGGVVQHGPRSAAGTIAHLPLPGQPLPGQPLPGEGGTCGCGRTGCLQAVVSERALAARAAAAGVVREPSFALLLDAAMAGHPAAVAMFRQRARAVGAAAAVLLDLLNPEVLVVVEAGAMHVPGCLDVLRAEARRQCAGTGEPPITVTSFGRDVLPIAAGTVMLSEIYANPLAI
jgi:predicted NBD/HSP70 family sugar kinase